MILSNVRRMYENTLTEIKKKFPIRQNKMESGCVDVRNSDDDVRRYQ